MDAPTGIDLHPSPPSVARVSKRAGFTALCVVCGVAGLLGYGVYDRQNGVATLASEQEKNVVPASPAALEITKNIPTGVVNLATDRDKITGDSETSDVQQVSPQDVVTNTSGRSSSSPLAGSYQPFHTALQQEPTPEQRRLAEAYERELRAIAAPTGIQSANMGSFFQAAANHPPSPVGAVNGPDVPSLTALAHIFS